MQLLWIHAPVSIFHGNDWGSASDAVFRFPLLYPWLGCFCVEKQCHTRCLCEKSPCDGGHHDRFSLLRDKTSDIVFFLPVGTKQQSGPKEERAAVAEIHGLIPRLVSARRCRKRWNKTGGKIYELKKWKVEIFLAEAKYCSAAWSLVVACDAV